MIAVGEVKAVNCELRDKVSVPNCDCDASCP